jgi:hypothetical protein
VFCGFTVKNSVTLQCVHTLHPWEQYVRFEDFKAGTVKTVVYGM